MNKSKILILLIVLIFSFLLQGSVFSQYVIKYSAFGNGSSVVSDSGYTSVAVTGQTLIGESTDSVNLIKAGFIYQSAKIFTSVEKVESTQIPKKFRLDQNYPNPFNPSTTIQFALPKECRVCLRVFDVMGREVAKVIDEKMSPGDYRVIFEAENLPSGLYIYQIQAEEFSHAKKFTLLK